MLHEIMRKTYRMKHFKIYYIIPILIITGIGIAALFRMHNQPVRNAEKILTAMLNLPAEPIKEAYGTMDTVVDDIVKNSQKPDIFSPDDTLIKQAYEEMFGDIVSDNFIEDCIRLDNIAFLHYRAMEQGTSAALQELNMARTNQKDTLTYVAELLVHTSGTDEKQIQITGQIQLDNNGKIHAVHVNGQELLRILETQN